MRRVLFVASLLAPLPLNPHQSSPSFATCASSYLAAPTPLPDSVDRAPTYVNRTVRQIVRATLGGERVRIRLTNEYGERPLIIGSAHVALRDSGTAISSTTDREKVCNRIKHNNLRFVFPDQFIHRYQVHFKSVERGTRNMEL